MTYYTIGLFSEAGDEILHRADNKPGFSYDFKQQEENSPMPRFQTVRFKMKKNAESFIQDLQDKPDPKDTFSEEVAVFLSDLKVKENNGSFSETSALDYGMN